MKKSVENIKLKIHRNKKKKKRAKEPTRKREREREKEMREQGRWKEQRKVQNQEDSFIFWKGIYLQWSVTNYGVTFSQFILSLLSFTLSHLIAHMTLSLSLSLSLFLSLFFLFNIFIFAISLFQVPASASSCGYLCSLTTQSLFLSSPFCHTCSFFFAHSGIWAHFAVPVASLWYF